MKNLNACLASLNLGLPDDVRRLKEAGYYTEAIACIDTYLAEDWTKTQNQPVLPEDCCRCTGPKLCPLVS